ncbi:MAG: type II toxin-antitoxin system VapC family toxin, partial [Chloroflexi bacterium]|nr:type II toxin-antitoxin system VapC family toxin [Chloroflexota bacterium]
PLEYLQQCHPELAPPIPHPVSYVLNQYTDWLISLFNDRVRAVRLLVGLEPEGLAVSTITLGELFEGLPGISAPQELQAYLQRLPPSVTLLSPDVNCAYQYARIRLELHSTGNLIPENDLWIAATALAYNLTLVSRDPHFQRVQELRVYVL